ncbi:MAG: DNA repair exonuclease [Pseudomonadota bacterium]
MRILATADIHLGSPIRSVAMRSPELGSRLKAANRDAFVRLVDLAIEQSADVLAIAGDIFDNSYPELRHRAFFLRQVARAAKSGIEVVLIRGNHDALLGPEWGDDLGPGVHVLTKARPTVEIKGTAFHGLSFESSHEKQSLLPEYPAPRPGAANVGLMHTSLDGAEGHDPYAPCSEADLIGHGYDLWCLGHIHAPFVRRSDASLVVMPGIPQPRHFGERRGGQVALIDLGAEPSLTLHSVAVLRFEDATISLDGAATSSEALAALEKAFTEVETAEMDTALRLSVETEGFNREELESLAAELLEDRERVFLDRLKVFPPRDAGQDKADDLLRLMRAEIASPAFDHASRQILDDLRTALPREAREALADGELDDIVQDAIRDVLVSVRAAG